jgi:O-antigen/teichoic acid export membrane protein
LSAASDSKTVAKAASVNLVGMAARSSRALVTLFVTRVSGPGIFGLFTLALAVVDIVGRLALFGMDKSVLKFIPEQGEGREDRRYAILSASLWIGLGLGLALSLAVALLAPWIAARWLSEPGVTLPLRIVGLSILPTTLASLFLAATKALKVMSYDAFVTGMLLPLSLLLLSVPIVWAQDDLAVLAVAYTGSCLAGVVASTWFFRRHFSLRRSFARPEAGALRTMAAFSTPLGLHDFVQFLSMKVELFILAAFVSPAELGVYALASELAVVIKKFRQIFDPILIPMMSEAHGLQDKPRQEAHIARVVRWVLVLGVFYLGAVALFPRSVLGLFGAAFVGGAGVLVLLCVAQLLNSATGLLDTAMLVSGRPRINLQNMSLMLVAQTGLNLWLIPRWGLLGAAWAALAANAMVSVVRLGQTVWILRLNPFHRSHLKPLVAGAGAGAAIALLGRALGPSPFPLAWVVLLAAFAALYALTLRGLGFAEEDADLLRAVLRRGKETETRV